MKKKPLKPSSIVASHRIELAGDWSDLPAYCERHGGRVINMAVRIDPFVIEALAWPIALPVLCVTSLDQKISVVISDAQELVPGDPTSDPFGLMRATLLDTLEISLEQSASMRSILAEYIGAGLRIVTNSTAPMGSGLGTSSIVSTAIRLLLKRIAEKPLDYLEACWQTYRMETKYGFGSGWQDQIGGIFAGIKDIVYDPSAHPIVSRLTIPARMIRQMCSWIVVAHSGGTRYSGDILNEVGSSLARSRRSVSIVDSLKGLCEPVCRAAESGDYTALGTLVSQITKLQRLLHPHIVPPHIGDVFSEASAHCHGCRVCGAGSEGFLLFFTRGNRDKHLLLKLLDERHFTTYSLGPGRGVVFY